MIHLMLERAVGMVCRDADGNRWSTIQRIGKPFTCQECGLQVHRAYYRRTALDNETYACPDCVTLDISAAIEPEAS